MRFVVLPDPGQQGGAQPDRQAEGRADGDLKFQRLPGDRPGELRLAGDVTGDRPVHAGSEEYPVEGEEEEKDAEGPVILQSQDMLGPDVNNPAAEDEHHLGQGQVHCSSSHLHYIFSFGKNSLTGFIL